MKLYYTPAKPYLSHSFQRVWEGLDSTKPHSAEWVSNIDDADVVFAPVVNWNDVKDAPIDKRWVILQFCYLTAGGTEDGWEDLWKKARLVVSYLDLPYESLRIPLGYDPKKFYDMNLPKKYRAITTGYVDGVGAEYIKAVYEAFGNVMHIGANFDLGKGYHHTEKVSDDLMRTLYNSADYVVSLRDIEGFELPLLEGAACGAQPIALDLECYRRWFHGIALFIDPKDVLNGLKEVASQPNLKLYSNLRLFEWEVPMMYMWKELK